MNILRNNIFKCSGRYVGRYESIEGESDPPDEWGMLAIKRACMRI